MALSVRGYPPPTGPCDLCATAGAPTLAIVVEGTLALVCIWCLARPLEEATGWRIGNAWRQWDELARFTKKLRAGEPLPVQEPLE